jgi:hypothetical protein
MPQELRRQTRTLRVGEISHTRLTRRSCQGAARSFSVLVKTRSTGLSVEAPRETGLEAPEPILSRELVSVC